MRVLRGLVRGGLVGAVFGVLARSLMRVVALLMGEEVEYDLVASSRRRTSGGVSAALLV
jgi:hypothetical protein